MRGGGTEDPGSTGGSLRPQRTHPVFDNSPSCLFFFLGRGRSEFSKVELPAVQTCVSLIYIIMTSLYSQALITHRDRSVSICQGTFSPWLSLDVFLQKPRLKNAQCGPELRKVNNQLLLPAWGQPKNSPGTLGYSLGVPTSSLPTPSRQGTRSRITSISLSTVAASMAGHRPHLSYDPGPKTRTPLLPPPPIPTPTDLYRKPGHREINKN